MSAEIINLRRARKARTRSSKEKTAAENRALFSMTRAERDLVREERTRARRHLDGLHLDHKASTPSGTDKDGDGREN